MSGFWRCNVTSHNLHIGIKGFQAFNRAQNTSGMAVRCIYHQHVHTSFNQHFGAVKAIFAHTCCCCTAQAAQAILDSQRMSNSLIHILNGDDTYATVCIINHQQFFNAVLVQQLAGRICIHTVFNRDQPILGHQLGNRLVGVYGKASITVGKNTHQLLRAGLNHGQAANAVAVHDITHFGQCLIRANGNRVHHHAGFKALNATNLLGLLFRLQVFMDHTKAALLGHGNSHLVFRNRIHSGGNQRDIEFNRAREMRANGCLAGHNVRCSRHNQHIVKRQSFRNTAIGRRGHAAGTLAEIQKGRLP